MGEAGWLSRAMSVTRIPDASLLMGLLMIWLLRLLLPWPGFSGTGFVLAGWLLIVAGVASALIVLSGLRRFNTSTNAGDRPTRLVTTGLYGATRNPYYLACAIVLTGIATLTGSAATFLVPAAYVITLNRFVIPIEEKLLLQEFGGEYDRYRQRFRRWL